MRYVTFGYNPGNRYTSAILIKETALNQNKINEHYVKPLVDSNLIEKENIISFSLDYGNVKKPSKKTIQNYCSILLEGVAQLGVKHLLVADPEYFKYLTGKKKTEPYMGYVLPCVTPKYETMNVVLIPNYNSLYANPLNQSKIDTGISTFLCAIQNKDTGIGENIIKYSYYPSKLSAIESFLNSLHRYKSLVVDTETFSLKHYKAGLGSIGFAWDQHSGGAFLCDYTPVNSPLGVSNEHLEYGVREDNKEVKQLLKKFFDSYKGKLIFQNASFDLRVLIYELYMDSLIDQKGMLEGLHILCRDVDDTKVISYLATNNCAKNNLGLKDQAQEYAGNFAEEDVDNILRIPSDQLLTYNLTDCCATWFVFNKNTPIMIQDNQLDVYNGIFRPSIKTITQMELTGLCLSMPKVLHAEKVLKQKVEGIIKYLEQLPAVKQYLLEVKNDVWIKDYEDRKAKAKYPENIKYKDLSAMPDIVFNPNSPKLTKLLYEIMGLPVIDKTKKGAPSLAGDTLEKLVNHTKNPEYKKVLTSLFDFTKADKILTSFIPAFKEAPLAPDGCYYLFGNFNLGGTKSGRLSSSDVNLQQLPSTRSPYAKLIKDCFIAPPGYLMVGLDYDSLEDYISALTTKDPNKIKVYEMGFDGHSLRAANYFKDQLSHINLDDPDSVNSIKVTHEDLRQDSKAPTFALTYQGTYSTLMNNCGFTLEEAKAIEANYHELYKVSTAWVQEHIKQACDTGYVECAFGLRLRTPILHKTKYENIKGISAAESRTAGNALGQSWGLLNTRACNYFMADVWASPYSEDIRIAAQIHDASYYYIKNDVDILKFLNDRLVTHVKWQDHPAIQHDTVKLGGAVDIFYPSWKYAVTLPNFSTEDEIIKKSEVHQNKLKENQVCLNQYA